MSTIQVNAGWLSCQFKNKWQKFISLKPNRFIGSLLFEHGLDPISDIRTEHCGVKREDDEEDK